jgi:predicted transcriptional regulator
MRATQRFTLMNKKVLQELSDRELSTYQIASTMECSQTNVRYWLKKYGITTSRAANSVHNICHCLVCGGALKGMQQKFCCITCKTAHYASCKSVDGYGSSYASQKTRGRDRKLQLIKIKGGGCSRCGYAKNYSALCFHHRDPNNKGFNLDMRRCACTSWATLLEEAAKCELLCQNCHAEIHHPSHSIN